MGIGAKEGKAEDEARGMASCQEWGLLTGNRESNSHEETILFGVVVGAILVWWLRSVKRRV